MRIYLTGADGLLGTAFTAALADDPDAREWSVVGVSVRDFDICDRAAVHRSITGVRPDVVVHAAANAIVDDCERDPRRALDVNVAGVRNVAEACLRTGSWLVYVSSDYVFDGERPPPTGYREDDLPNPLNVYGVTKLAGEAIAALCPDSLVVRTSWLFGGADERVDPVLHTVRRAQRGLGSRLIADQFSLPTYTADVARAMLFLIRSHPTLRGVLHVANSGSASWHEVITYALAQCGPDLAEFAPEPQMLAGHPFLGRRPRDSTLNTDRLAGLGYRMPDWRDGVRRFCATLRTADAVLS